MTSQAPESDPTTLRSSATTQRASRRWLVMLFAAVILLLVAAVGIGAVILSMLVHDVEPPLGPGVAQLPHQPTFLTTGTNGIIARIGQPPRWRWLVQSKHLWSFAAANDGQTLYAGTDSGWVWRSTDGGRHWVRADHGLPANLFPAGTGHMWLYSLLGLYHQATTTRLAVAPTDPSVVYAVVSHPETDLYRSTDGGVTWQMMDLHLPRPNLMTQVLIDPWNAGSVWVGTLDSGLYHSADGGHTWVHMHQGGLPAEAAVNTLTATGRVVYAALSPHLGVGRFGPSTLYRSTDGGIHWIRLQRGLPADLNLFGGLALSPVQPRRVYGLTSQGVAVSSDGGLTWTAGRGITANVYGIIADPVNPRVAYAYGTRKIYRTADGGQTWQLWDNGKLPAGQELSNLVLS